MKTLIQKVQALGKTAGEIKAALHSAPGKAAELRKALTMTAGEFQQLRADVQTNVTGLRAHSEDHLLQAMREINDRTEAFEEAGYELTGMDLDLTLTQRLAVHLRKFNDVSQSTLRSLAAKESSVTVKSIFAGIISAEDTAANVELTHLKFDGLMIHIGAMPLVRICWSTDTLLEEAQAMATQASPMKPVAPAPAESSATLGSYFEPKPLSIRATATTRPPEPEIDETIESSAVPPHSAAPVATPSKEPAASTSPWSKEALDRFKKMPSLSKHRSQ